MFHRFSIELTFCVLLATTPHFEAFGFTFALHDEFNIIPIGYIVKGSNGKNDCYREKLEKWPRMGDISMKNKDKIPNPVHQIAD
jgi:hypothetical protein